MIHSFQRRKKRIIVDTYSGSVHIVDKDTQQAIELIDQLKSIDQAKEKLGDDYKEIFEEIELLIDQKLLFSKDSYKDLSLDLRKRPSHIKALCLNVAHTCNLSCDYCFASQGKYKGERALMSWEVAKKSIDFLLHESKNHHHLDIDFFGGEPLMNWDLVKETVFYAKSLEEEYDKKFRFTLTTNGILLDDEKIDFLNQYMDNVVLSLDGRKEIHDQLRRTINDQGSYDIIVPKFQKFIEKRGDREYYIRGTYTRNNLDFFQDIKHMADLGFSSLSMEPVIGDPSEDYMLTMDDLDRLLDEYDKLADYMIKRNKQKKPITFYHFMLNLEEGPCIYKRISGCGAGTEYMAVVPNGDLYPCHQFAGEDEFLMGNVFTGIDNEKLGQDFKECNCYSREECQDCWAKLYCSGGCSANAYHYGKNLKSTIPLSCELFKKRMECALDIKAEELDR